MALPRCPDWFKSSFPTTQSVLVYTQIMCLAWKLRKCVRWGGCKLCECIDNTEKTSYRRIRSTQQEREQHLLRVLEKKCKPWKKFSVCDRGQKSQKLSRLLLVEKGRVPHHLTVSTEHCPPTVRIWCRNNEWYEERCWIYTSCRSLETQLWAVTGAEQP